MNARKFLNATAAVLLATSIGRVLGVMREIITAKYFGTGPIMDAFIVGIRIPDILYNALISSLVATPFIPVFASLIAQETPSRYWRFFSSILNISTAMSLLCALALFAGSDLVITAIAPGLVDAAHQVAVELSRIMIPIIVFGAVAGLLKSVLNTFGRFGLPALAPVVYNCAVIGSLLLLAENAGIRALAYGVLGGALAQALLLVPSLWSCGAKYTPVAHLRDQEVAMVGRLFWPVLASLLVAQGGVLIELYIASNTVPGAISYLNYAMRLFNLPQQLYLIVVSTIIFPMISQRAAVGEQNDVVRLVSYAATVTMIIMIPGAILMFGLANDVVSLVLQRGAFDHRSAEGTTAAFSAFACGLPYYCLTNLIPFAFFAMKKNKFVLVMTALFWGVNIILDLTLVALISYPGIAWAGSITAFVQSLVYAAMLTRLPLDVAGSRPGVGSWAMTAAPAIVLSLALIGCTFAGKAADTLVERVLVTGSIALAAAGVFGGLLWWSGDVGLTAMSALVVRSVRELRRPNILSASTAAADTRRQQ
jgi:putative peptidoglycan lipid II flippase